ncbi:MAG: PASTA domain-containing protein [Actinomycetota bacterium]|nr:PASTA domain-containing protein [Actinomycetota bacterium]
MSTYADQPDRMIPSLRGRLTRCAGLATALGAFSLSAGSAVALADGAPTVASATPVVYGQLEFGSTLTGAVTTDGLDAYESYWALPVTNGDDVTIDWQAPLDSNANGPLLSAYEVGTNDLTLADAGPISSDPLGSDGLDEMTFTADATGVMPLQFESNYCCSESLPGVYQFTAKVSHAVVLTVPKVSSLSAKGTINVGVANPDGGGLSDPSLVVALQVQAGGGQWSTIGTALASGGSAKIAYTAPGSLDGKTVKLHALAQGAAYQTETSSSQPVSVATSASGPGSGSGSGGSGSSGGTHSGRACVVPSLVGKKLGLAKHALHGAGCSLGHVSHKHAKHSGRGRVIWQSQMTGAHLRNGTKVTLVVGR